MVNTPYRSRMPRDLELLLPAFLLCVSDPGGGGVERGGGGGD